MFKVSNYPVHRILPLAAVLTHFFKGMNVALLSSVKKNSAFFLSHYLFSISNLFFLSELQIKRLSLKENVRTILKLIILKRSKDGCIQVKKRRKLIFITLDAFQRVKARANDARRSLKYRSIYRLLSSCHIKFNEGSTKPQHSKLRAPIFSLKSAFSYV